MKNRIIKIKNPLKIPAPVTVGQPLRCEKSLRGSFVSWRLAGNMSIDSFKKTLDDFIIWICQASDYEREQVLAKKLAQIAEENEENNDDKTLPKVKKNRRVREVILDNSQTIKKTRTLAINTETVDTQNISKLKVHKGGRYTPPEPKVINNDPILTAQGAAWLRAERATTQNHENA